MNLLLKKTRGIVRKNFARLPDSLRANLERRLFQILPDGPPKDMVFKIAETKEELEQAFRILHDSYVREGYMVADASGLRITPYHAIPTTTTLIAKIGERVVGTVSLIRQSSLRLPIQTAFDISQVTSSGDQIVEISSLAIDRSYRGTSAQLLFWLSKYVFEYCRTSFAIDFIFVTIHPRQIDLYENIILFQRLSSPSVDRYGFANGAPAVAEYIDMREYSNRLLDVYWNKPPERNVYAFIMVRRLSRQFHFPERAVYTVNDPVMTPEFLDYFFNLKTDVFKNLSDEQLEALHEIYRECPEYLRVLPEAKAPEGAKSRRQIRYQVNCPASFTLQSEGALHGCTLIQVSNSGFLAKVQHPLNHGDALKARVQINALETVEVDATVVWCDRQGLGGFKIVSENPGWKKLIGHLKTERNKLPDRRVQARRSA